jgi:hypothetical protein
MMKCANCGLNFDQPVKFCPDCGTPVQPGAAAESPGTAAVRDTVPSAGQAYIRADYDPTRDGRPTASAAYAAPPVYQTRAPVSGGYSAQTVKRPSGTGMIVFAIINMLCCGLGISFILGIIALIFAIMSGSELSAEEAERKIRTAKILNFIGLGFIILQVLITVLFIAGSLFFAERTNGFNYFDSNYFNN